LMGGSIKRGNIELTEELNKKIIHFQELLEDE